MSSHVLHLLAGVVIICLATCAKGFNLAVVTWGNPSVELAKLDTDGQQIVGIGHLHNRLFVVCVMNNTLFVFENHSPYSRIALIHITALAGMGPGDLVADCERLYIIDWRPASAGNTRVWSVDPVDLSVEYLVNATRWTGTLALTRRRYVLGVSGNSNLNLFRKPDGLTVLPLPTGTVDPQHAQRSTLPPWSKDQGTFYVTVGWKSGQPHRVLHVSADGSTVLQQYGDVVPGNGTGQLNWPHHIALVQTPPAGETVLVADFWNRRVVQLDAKLSTASDLVSAASTPGFGWPDRLLVIPGKMGNCGKPGGALRVLITMSETAPDWGSF